MHFSPRHTQSRLCSSSQVCFPLGFKSQIKAGDEDENLPPQNSRFHKERKRERNQKPFHHYLCLHCPHRVHVKSTASIPKLAEKSRAIYYSQALNHRRTQRIQEKIPTYRVQSMFSKPVHHISDCSQDGKTRNSFGGNSNSIHVHQSNVNLVKDASTKSCWA